MKPWESKAKASIDYNLLAYITHEVKGPFNGLLGFSEILLNKDFAPDKQEEFKALVAQLASKSYLQLQTFATWVKLISENLHINYADVKPEDIFKSVQAYVASDLESKVLTLQCSNEERNMVNGDLQLLSIAMANIIYLASKIAKQETSIQLIFSKTSGAIVFSCAATDITSVFHEYRQGELTETGFRLWIAEQIFLMHHLPFSIDIQNGTIMCTWKYPS